MIVRFPPFPVQTAQGQAISGALVYFLDQPADTDTLTPLANVYADLTGDPAPNPQVTDGLGDIACYLSDAQLYTIVVVSPQINTLILPDQSVGNSSGSGSLTPVQASTAAGTITGTIDGTNTVFTLPSTPSAGSLQLSMNGVSLTLNVGYTITGATVTLAVAPQPGDGLNANYLV
jgi:hypothetical protein